MVHRREINGEAIILGNQGDLFQNALTWFDHETGSVWSQPTGEAILGELTGTTLELLPSTVSTWGAWQDRFPETTALEVDNRGSGFSLDSLLIVASVNDDTVAVEYDQLTARGAVPVDVGGEPVLFVADEARDSWAVYSRRIDGEVADIELRNGNVFDPATGNEWDASRGSPIGSHGIELARLPVFTSLEDDYPVFFPDGELLDLLG